MRAFRHGQEEHYNLISAFIKSMRGSDPDAALYWLARILEVGEDPRFVARRLVILASEDVGLADPMALVVATAAASAVELVGLPEGALNLAQATVHLALAPKSNSTALGIWRAQSEVRSGPFVEVPPTCGGRTTRERPRSGSGIGYEYPHDDPRGFIEQEYLPGELAGIAFFRASCARGRRGLGSPVAGTAWRASLRGPRRRAGKRALTEALTRATRAARATRRVRN